MSNKNELVDPLITLALSSVVKEAAYKGASASMLPGTYAVDVTVRIQGGITKGADYTQAVVASVPVWDLLALALSKLNGVTVKDIVAEYATKGEVDVEELKKTAQEAINSIKATTTRLCNGKVNSALTFQVIPAEQKEKVTG